MGSIRLKILAVLAVVLTAACYGQTAHNSQQTKAATILAKEAFTKAHPGARIESYSTPPSGNIACTIDGVEDGQRIIFAVTSDGSIAEDVVVPEGFPKNGMTMFRELHPDAKIFNVSKFHGAGNDGYTILAAEDGKEVVLSILASWSIGDHMIYESIEMKDVPAAVTETLNKEYPGRKQYNPKRVIKNCEIRYCVSIEPDESDPDIQGTPYLTPEGKIESTKYRIESRNSTK